MVTERLEYPSVKLIYATSIQFKLLFYTDFYTYFVLLVQFIESPKVTKRHQESSANTSALLVQSHLA